MEAQSAPAKNWEFPQISDAQPLTDRDDGLVKDLTDVLERHNALGRLGVVLLHQHFPIAEDEILCETVDVENRVLVTRPVKKTEVEKEPHTITLWNLRDGTAVMGCVCVNYPGTGGHSHYPSPTEKRPPLTL